MKKMLLLVSVLLLSTSCLTIEGQVRVTEAFTVKKKSGFLNLKTSNVKVEPNLYSGKLTVKSDKNYNFHLEGGSLGKIIIPIKASSDLDIPRDGAFSISSQKIAQPFDLSGVINTDENHYGYTEAIEQCSWNVTEKKCDKVCNKETQKCEIICKDVVITLHGEKEVAFHYRSIRRDLSLEFMRAGSTGVIATFSGTDTQTDKIIDRESQCRSFRR